MERIAWFRKIKSSSILLVGKKALELNDLYSNEYPVSPGFVVTADAYREFFLKIEEKIMPILENIDVNNNQKLQNSANQIQRIILSTKIPLKFEDELREAYDSMDVPITIGKKRNVHFFLNTTQKAKVIVRSSPVALKPEAIALSEVPTYLNVEGIEQLKRAIKACWASIFTSKSIRYRIKNNFNQKDVYNAVLIQKMVQSEKSGFVFTLNPSNGNKKEIVIEAIRGYNLGLKEFHPSIYVIEKKSNKVINKHEVEQRYGYFGAEKGRSVKKELSYSISSQPVLSDLEISRLTNLAKDLEMELNKPLKIEFAVQEERAFITDLKELKSFKEVQMQEETEEIEEEEKEVEEEKEEEPQEEETSEETEEETTEEVEEEPEEETTEETEEEPEEEETTEETEEEPEEEETTEETEEEPEEEETTEETEEEPEEEPEEETTEEATEEDDEPKTDKEQRLNEVFEDYSERINQLLSELKEEFLRILKD